MSEPSGIRQALMLWRGIEELCRRCGGSGVRVYSSTAMWRGGCGGQMITRGPCDLCWGSGDEGAPWANLRKLEAELARLKEALTTRR